MHRRAVAQSDAAEVAPASEFSGMTPSDPSAAGKRRDSAVAISIIFFAVAVLCLLLGWAEGVRRDTRYLHIPETGNWLIATAILGALGVLFLLWSRAMKRG
ncbi:MAG: hypothetical protein H0X34_02835 [Chthoniobacterales bacterium]|nr:hypothetical protein [Chthoniobacterales bacterium]